MHVLACTAMNVKVEAGMPRELVEKIDRARGDVSRSLWIRRAVERALEADSSGKPARAPAPAEQPASDRQPPAGGGAGAPESRAAQPLNRADAFRNRES